MGRDLEGVAEMNVVLQAPDRLLISITADELLGISNALNEICNGVHLDDVDFNTRIGVSRPFLVDVLRQLTASDDGSTMQVASLSSAWHDGASVQSICVTASGDPVDMSTTEAAEFMEQLSEAIRKAED